MRYEISDTRAVLKFRAQWKGKRIAVTEIAQPAQRSYSYYLLEGRRLLLGLDNAPDRPALRLKYGKEFTVHLYESVPHLHADPHKLELTDEKMFEDFVRMVLEFKESS
ncbi:MAG: hypothetical protein KGJ80_01315 [Chloroflexota bacterium]|nr:hypothetical protein [Chloroflexota bacterium]